VVRGNYGCTLWSNVFFSSYVNGLSARYPELFEGDGTSTQHQINFGKKWKGYASIYELADGDIKKMDVVVNEPLEKCLLFLSYKADKVLLDNLVHKEMMKRVG
jgi:hypothetical protein